MLLRWLTGRWYSSRSWQGKSEKLWQIVSGKEARASPSKTRRVSVIGRLHRPPHSKALHRCTSTRLKISHQREEEEGIRDRRTNAKWRMEAGRIVKIRWYAGIVERWPIWKRCRTKLWANKILDGWQGSQSSVQLMNALEEYWTTGPTVFSISHKNMTQALLIAYPSWFPDWKSSRKRISSEAGIQYQSENLVRLSSSLWQ